MFRKKRITKVSNVKLDRLDEGWLIRYSRKTGDKATEQMAVACDSFEAAIIVLKSLGKQEWRISSFE